jgi:phosphoribosyl-ATP pyrophosphohydrolase
MKAFDEKTLDVIFHAITVLQNAGLDTTSVTMSLTHRLGQQENETQENKEKTNER